MASHEHNQHAAIFMSMKMDDKVDKAGTVLISRRIISACCLGFN